MGETAVIAVVGCGNANRSDDGVGPEVVRLSRARAADEAIPDVRFIDAGTDGMAAMFAARGCRSLILVDACRSGSPPGAVFEPPSAAVARGGPPPASLHDFRWEHALHAGRQIFRDDFPADVVVLLIEAESVDFGIGLSPAVSTSVAIVVERIMELLKSRAKSFVGSP
jgi:hydrogenase maturation protease